MEWWNVKYSELRLNPSNKYVSTKCHFSPLDLSYESTYYFITNNPMLYTNAHAPKLSYYWIEVVLNDDYAPLISNE